jgi:hypothetical protein
MLYAIVSFDDYNETDFMPLKWIADNVSLAEVPNIIEKRETVRFYWPPYKNPVAVSKAKRNRQDPEVGWPTYQGRILSTASKHSTIVNHIVQDLLT